MFDTLLSADLSVDDPDRVASVLVDKLSLPEPQPSWMHNWPETQYRAYFLRANSRRVGAPTAIEVIGPHPETGLNASLRAIHLGYTHVYWYRGGLAAWQAAGLPLTNPSN